MRLGTQALELAGQGYPTERGLALVALGAAHETMHHPAEAEASYAAGADLMLEHGSPRDRTDAFRAWARFLQRQGRETEALDVLDRAADVMAHGEV